MIMLTPNLYISEDCADGTCYEGACAGNRIFSTDGTCGSEYGDRRCTGVWGDCCNVNGKCGSGGGFCGMDVCQSGKCTQPAIIPDPPGPNFWFGGNTTDGMCGGPDSFTCNLVYGMCCNKDNISGSLPSDCGTRW